MKRLFMLFALLLTLGASAFAQTLYVCIGNNVPLRMGPGANYKAIVSTGGMHNPYQEDKVFYLQKGGVLKYDGAQKNGFVKVFLMEDLPYFIGPNDEINVGWVPAKSLKRVVTCTACKGTGRKGTCPECHGEGMGYCCSYTGLGVCKACNGKGYK